MNKACSECGRSLEHKRADAVVCSTKCRVRAHRRSNVFPEEMRTRARWVRRTADKRPVTAQGGPASVTTPLTWCTFEEARRSTVGAGMGYVLGDGIGCYDLDHCITDGVLDSWAQEVLDSIPDPLFVEVSQSGAGLHVFVRTSALVGKVDRRDDGYSVEFYPNRRYIAVTGNAYSPQ